MARYFAKRKGLTGWTFEFYDGTRVDRLDEDWSDNLEALVDATDDFDE